MIASRFFRYIPTKVPRWMKYIVSIVLLTLLIVHIDWSAVGQEIISLQWRWLLLYSALIIGGNVLSAYRWYILAQKQGFSHSTGRFVRWYITGTFINNFLPSFLGGDAYRAYMLGRSHNNATIPAIFTVIVDRAIGLLAGVFIALLAGGTWAMTSTEKVVTSFAYGAFIVMAIAAFLGTLLLSYRITIIDFFMRILPRRYRDYAILMRRYSTPTLIYSTLLGMLFMLFGVVAANYILFLALGTLPPLVPFVFFVMIASIIAAAPVSIGNIGIKEWSYITLFGTIGVGAPTAVTVVIIGRVMQALISCIGIPLYLGQDRVLRQQLHKVNVRDKS